MKQSTKLKACAFLLIMAACGVMQAQIDGFFSSDVEYTNRDAVDYGLNNQTFGAGGYNLTNQTFGEGGYNLTNQTFGDNAPIGSGLLIMTIAGAGYAIRKRKNN